MSAPTLIGVGSNVGDRLHYIGEARKLLVQQSHIRLLRESSIYETKPVGDPSQGKYLNAVWEVETELTPRGLLEVLQKIEKRLGRTGKGKQAARTIDLDIILKGNQMVNEPDLVVPHPRFQDRWFVLKPISELYPDLVHPILKEHVTSLLSKVESQRGEIFNVSK